MTADGDRQPIRHRRRMHSPALRYGENGRSGNQGVGDGLSRRPRAVTFAEEAHRSLCRRQAVAGRTVGAVQRIVLDCRRISAVSLAHAVAPDDGPIHPDRPGDRVFGRRRDTRPDGPRIPTPASWNDGYCDCNHDCDDPARSIAHVGELANSVSDTNALKRKSALNRRRAHSPTCVSKNAPK